MAGTAVPFSPGSIIEGRYRVDGLLARGGMSTVFRGLDLRLDRRVAIKVLDPAFAADPAQASRFVMEARSVAKLSHPNLVNVHDQGRVGHHAFLVMEYVDGGTLRHLLAERGPMPAYAAVAVLRPVLAALAVAHRARLIHRDVKPDNVLISRSGTVKLADFGLVQAMTVGNNPPSRPLMGTAAYLSPEQVAGDAVGPESDLYSLGIVFYELLTGAAPFGREATMAVAERRLTSAVPAPSEQRPDIPREIDELVLRATARRPEDRWASATEMLAEVTRVAEMLDLPAYDVPAPGRATDEAVWSGDDHAPTQAVPRAVPTTTGRTETITNDGHRGGPGDTRVFGAAAGMSTATDPPRSSLPGAPQHTLPVPHDVTLAENVAPGAEDRPGEFSGEHPVVTTQRRDRRRLSLILALVTVLTLVAAIMAWWFGSGRWTTVPDTQGMNPVVASQAVEQADLSPVLTRVYSDDVAKDRFAGTDPTAGTRIVRGSDVAITVSQGKPTVPELGKDRSQDAVKDLLTERTLRMMLGDAVYSTTPKGDIAELDPAPGTTVSVGSEVRALPSKGPRPVAIPRLDGLSQADAEEALRRANLTVGRITLEFDENIDGAHVISSTPPSGAQAHEGDTVDLAVSTAVTIPDVTGKTPEEAEAAFAEAGISASRGEDVGGDVGDNVSFGRVAETDPPSGSRVDSRDATVFYHVSKSLRLPFLIGRTGAEAERILSERGLKVEFARSLRDDPRSGIVIAQSPGPRTTVTSGDTVRLTVV